MLSVNTPTVPSPSAALLPPTTRIRLATSTQPRRKRERGRLPPSSRRHGRRLWLLLRLHFQLNQTGPELGPGEPRCARILPQKRPIQLTRVNLAITFRA